jgi:hypothetical protein
LTEIHLCLLWSYIIEILRRNGRPKGFEKETYYWFRSWWLSNIATKDAGRPPIANSATTIYIVDTWRLGLKADGSPMDPTRNIHVYTNAPYVSM